MRLSSRATIVGIPYSPWSLQARWALHLHRVPYRFEAYTPAPKRQFGYYVWPFLLDGQLVARVDLKRTADALHVVGAFAEDGQDPARVAAALVPELQKRKGWGMPVAFFLGSAAFFVTRALVESCGEGFRRGGSRMHFRGDGVWGDKALGSSAACRRSEEEHRHDGEFEVTHCTLAGATCSWADPPE